MACLIYIAPEEWDWTGASFQQLYPPAGTIPISGFSKPVLSHRTAIKYGFDIGLRRLRDILKENDLKITFWNTGNAVEKHPDIIKELSDLGHEISGHSYNEGVAFPTLSREHQSEDIRKCIQLIQNLTGKRPLGWIGPGVNCDENTVELLAEEGFLYHADLQDDELPYFIDINGKTLVEIPYRGVGNVNDFYFFARDRMVPEHSLAYLKQAFDAYYQEAAIRPLHFNFGTHPFVSGRPDAALVFAEFLRYIKKHRDVWVATYQAVAEWWMKQFSGGYNL